MDDNVKDIDWYDPNGEKILFNRPDISVSRTDETTSTLIIYHAKVDDAGIYKCVAKSGDEEAEATVVVRVFRKYLECFLSKLCTICTHQPQH